jgi:hypothetical protein
MTERSPRRVLGHRTIVAVLAAAVALGVLLCLAVVRPGQQHPAAATGSAQAPLRASALRLHPLRHVVAGQRVISVAASNSSVIYGTDNGGVYATSAHARLRRLTGLPSPVVKLALDPSGRWLAAASTRNELAVVDTAHPTSPVIRRHIQTITPWGDLIPLTQLAIDRTGRLVAAQTDGIGIYDLHGNRPPHWLSGETYECSGARDTAFAGNTFIAAYDACANVWNTATLRLEHQVHFPSTGNALVGHHRILFTTFSHALLLDYLHTSPLPSAAADPGQPHPTLADILTNKTISTRRSPIQPVADDGRIAAALQDARLIFWKPAAHQQPTVVPLPFPAVCPSTTTDTKGPAQFSTSVSPDHKTLAISGYCPPPGNIDNDSAEAMRLSRLSTYRYWMLTYPSP